MIKSNSVLLAAIAIIFVNQLSQSQSVEIDDPYLWLEEVESERSLNWVKTQNEATKNRISSEPLFDSLRLKFLDAMNDKDKIIYPNIVGDFVYNFWQDEINERGLWRRMLKVDYMNQKTEWEVVLDLDDLSEKENKKWVFFGSSWLQPEYEICLLYLSDGGKDESVIREFNVVSKTFVEGGFSFSESKGGASWISPNEVLFTSNFGEGSLTTSGYPRQVKRLKRGLPIDEAEEVYESDSTNVLASDLSFYKDGKWFTFVVDYEDFYNASYYYLNEDKLLKLDQPEDAEFIGFNSNQILLSLQSDWIVGDVTYKAGALVGYDFYDNLKGELNVHSIYHPRENSSYVGATATEEFIVVNTIESIQNKLIKYTWNNNSWIAENIETPKFGSIYLAGSDYYSNEFFFSHSSFTSPSTLYHVKDDGTEVIKKLKDFFRTDNLEVQQKFVASKDGTMIPYFIVHRKDMILDGENPTLIYGYGGFNTIEQPGYSYRIGQGWLEQGGVYVLANIRGGGEFGPAWHKAGMQESKQNCFDDFYAISEDLISKKICSPSSLGAYGWSNGGLLAGAIFTQRPDLYSAVIVGAPLLDMKRYSKLLAGASWIGEYGDPDIPEEWEYIKKYSPYHNLHADKEYPEVFFVTSTKDDRVHPGHARKMAAKMNDMGHPFFYHETIEGGHGGSSTNAQAAELSASMYTYLNMKLRRG